MNNSFDPTDWIQSPEAVKAKENGASTEEREKVDSCADQLLAKSMIKNSGDFHYLDIELIF